MRRLKLWATLPLAALALAAAAAAERDPDWVQKRVCELKDSDTCDWRKIPWAASLMDARKLAKDEDKPVFLFTMDGNIDTGRC